MRPCISKLEKDVKSGKMMVWGTSIPAPGKLEPEHLEAGVGPASRRPACYWEKGKTSSKRAGHRVTIALNSQLRVPITCKSKEDPRQHPNIFAHRSPCLKSLLFCPSGSHCSTKPTKSWSSFLKSLAALSQINLNGRTVYKITVHSSSKVSSSRAPGWLS